MVCFKFIELLTILCIANTTIAFKCWCCSSDESDSAFCGKVLDESSMTGHERNVNLVDCINPTFKQGRDLITKCMFQITSKNGDLVYARSCVWEDSGASRNACLSLTPNYGYRMEACETCEGDKCNYMLPSDSDASTSLKSFYCTVLILLVIVLII